MNVWDILILLAVAGMVGLAVLSLRKGKSSGCHGGGSCSCGCGSCAGCPGCAASQQNKKAKQGEQ